ncbi:MAG: tetratricopeptide repeat protein [Candidatus Eiseniibacteriota bacterium]
MIPALRALALACWLVAGASIAFAAAPAAPAASPVPSTPAAHDSLPPHALGLGRAAFERSADQLLGVIENLEQVALAPAPSFPEADRAAFLLGEAYLALGSRERFASLAATVAGWRRTSPYTEWIAWRQKLLAGGAGDSLNALFADGKFDTTTRIGRDLAAAAVIRRATAMAASGQDPGPVLASLPHGSRHAGRAHHMQGVAALERNAPEEGRASLRALLEADSLYAARRDVLLALAGLAMDGSSWAEASDLYARADRDWTRERDALVGIGARAEFDSLWAYWRSDASLSDAIALDARPVEERARLLTLAAAKLDQKPEVGIPALDSPANSVRSPWPIAPPAADAWRAVERSGLDLAETEYTLAREQRKLDEETRLLAERRRYLASGRRRTGSEALDLGDHAQALDSLARGLDDLAARIRGVREEAERRIAARTARLLALCDDQLLWTRGMRHFHIEGPHRERPIRVPAGVPSPDSLTREEIALTQAIRAGTERMAAKAPELIARSYESAWTPRLIERVGTMGGQVRDARAWAGRLEAAIDSGLAASAASDSQRALAARVAELTRTADSLRIAHRALEARTAAEAVAQALARMDREREALDYGLAAAAYGEVAFAGRADSMAVTGTAGAPADSTQSVVESPDAVARRTAAIARARTFLERHPDSFARGEMRFRLADLRVAEDRQTFRERMARFTSGGQGETLPVLDYAEPLALYRSILAEDSTFAHLDAVLFNAGMLELEAGDPAAERSFSQLVARFPESAHGQEAYLRLGDMRFADKQYGDCIGFYERSAAGPDSGLRTIALYKMGWAHYNQDGYAAAADAFRLVLDLYGASPGVARIVDVEDEAFAYLVHSFARAGGADAFATYFDRIGRRPYELELLMAMGQHFRRFNLYAEAAATDKLSIARFPNDPKALTVAERLIDTQNKVGESAQVREAQAALAEHFAPKSAWAKEQASDSLRAAGAMLARRSWTSLALHHRAEGLKSNAREEWREALRYDRTLLENWPEDADAPIVELRAGDASARLDEYESALAHFGRAAATGKDSTAALALFQSVAVTDRWYESTRSGNALGRDSLAAAVMRSGDRLLERFPTHAGAADVAWRQGSLAYAHGMNDRAIADFERFAARHPNDARTPVAATLRAETLFRLERYADAETAFGAALEAARRAGRDSLAQRAEQALPICALRLAESAVAADSTDHAKHAQLFEGVATRYPKYAHAHAAQYRAGLSYLKAGRRDDGVRALRGLITNFPSSEYVRDAHLEIASAFEKGGDHGAAALAYREFGERYPDDESAGSALLRSADHYAQDGQVPKADEIRLGYVKKYPGDVESAMTIYEDLAKRELATVNADRPISTLIPPEEGAAAPTPAGAKGAKGTKSTKGAKGKTAGKASKAAPAAKPAASSSHLAEYLRRAALHPDLASRSVLAQVRYLEGEERRAACERVKLVQPLKTSLGERKQHLEAAIALYRKSIELGATEWAHASAYRIGETLVGFGEALQKSERPADLAGDDLLAYDEVLVRESRGFSERGEDVWMDLLRQSKTSQASAKEKSDEDEWVKRAREALWPRLGQRFLFRPELEYPLLNGSAPSTAKNTTPPASAPARNGAPGTNGLAEQGGTAR